MPACGVVSGLTSAESSAVPTGPRLPLATGNEVSFVWSSRTAVRDAGTGVGGKLWVLITNEGPAPAPEDVGLPATLATKASSFYLSAQSRQGKRTCRLLAHRCHQ